MLGYCIMDYEHDNYDPKAPTKLPDHCKYSSSPLYPIECINGVKSEFITNKQSYQAITDNCGKCNEFPIPKGGRSRRRRLSKRRSNKKKRSIRRKRR